MDTWINGYTQPIVDTTQDIYNTSGKVIDGSTVLSFTRKRISNDPRVSTNLKKCAASI